MLRSKRVLALVMGLALGMGAGMGMARDNNPEVCLETCRSLLCMICSFPCGESVDCYLRCMERYPTCPRV